MITVSPENPTDTPPAPEIEPLLPKVVEDVEPVVFPTAEELSVSAAPAAVAPEIISVWPLNPTETAPAPLIDSILPKVVLLVEPVVLPTTL